MSLDLFDSAIRNSDAEVARQAAPDLPSGFAENFETSLRLSTEWNNSNNSTFARQRALASYYDEVKARSGESLPLYGISDGVTLDDLNAGIAKIAEKNPDAGYLPLSEADIDTMARRRMAKAHNDAAAINARERTWGGTFGNLAGAMLGGLSDPVVQATLPLGGAGELGVALRALEFAAIAGGTQAGTAALSYSAREAAVPGSSKEIPGEIATAAIFGGALGGGIGLLGKWLHAGEKPLPTSLREDVNAGASEAQFNAANVFPGAAGETANRDAVLGTIDSILKGEPVKAGEGFSAAVDKPAEGFLRFYHGGSNAGDGPVWLTPQQNYAEGYARYQTEGGKVWHVDIPKDEVIRLGGYDEINGYPINFEAPREIQRQLKPLPQAAEVAAAADRAQRPLAHDVAPEAEAFDRVPFAHEDAASYWDNKLAAVTPEERAALGATDTAPAAAFARDLAPEQLAKLAADPEADSAVLRNLDRIRLEKPDADFTHEMLQADGTTQLVTRKLEDVLREIDGFEHTAKELLACATGMMAAE